MASDVDFSSFLFFIFHVPFIAMKNLHNNKVTPREHKEMKKKSKLFRIKIECRRSFEIFALFATLIQISNEMWFFSYLNIAQFCAQFHDLNL